MRRCVQRCNGAAVPISQSTPCPGGGGAISPLQSGDQRCGDPRELANCQLSGEVM